MAWTPPADAEEWTPPEGAIPMSEVVDNPNAAGLTVPPEVPPEVVPQSWLSALFPRASQADGAGRGAVGAALDVASLPGRAYASLGRPEGEGYQSALARTMPPQEIPQPGGRAGNEWTDRVAEMILRDPANIPLAAATMATAGATAPAWYTRLGLVGRGAVSGTGIGSAVAATRQAENVAASRPLSAGQAALDVGTGALLGTGAGMLAAIPGVTRSLGGKLLTTVVKPTDKAKFSGWNPETLMSELASESPTGYVPITLGGMREAGISAIEARALARQVAIQADETAGMARGAMPRVNLDDATLASWQALQDAAQSRALTGAMGSIPGAENWALRNLANPVQGATNEATIEQALRARQGLDQFAFVPNAKGTSAAREVAAKAGRRNINEQLDQVAPMTRAADARIAPLAAQMEGLGVVGSRRLNNALLNPTDVITGMMASELAGGGARGAGAGLGAALAERILRTPAPAVAAWQAGRLAEKALPLAFRQAAVARVPLGTAFLRQPTDNARGGR